MIEHNEKENYSSKGLRVNSIYMLNLDDVSLSNTKCLVTMSEDSWLCHMRLAHARLDLLNKAILKDLVIGLPKIKFLKDYLCDACQIENQTRVSYKSKNIVSTARPLELLHMDLFGSSGIKILGCNYHGFVIVDDYTRFCWTIFLSSKDETFLAFTKFAKLLQNKMDLKVVVIRRDHEGEFENHLFDNYINEYGIENNFSAPRTPQ